MTRVEHLLSPYQLMIVRASIEREFGPRRHPYYAARIQRRYGDLLSLVSDLIRMEKKDKERMRLAGMIEEVRERVRLLPREERISGICRILGSTRQELGFSEA